MQSFHTKDHQKIINYFHIKKDPGKRDIFFLHKTNKYIWYIKWIPWLKMIWIWNSISMNTSTEESDIDLFIITSKKRIWFVRLLITFIFTFLWVRKTSKHHAGRFCLSFFCTEKGMNFSNFVLKNDIYLYFWILYLKPILNYDNTYKKFIDSQDWAQFDEYAEIIEWNEKYIQYIWNSFWNNSNLLNICNEILKKIFLPKTLKNYEKLNQPYGIIINEDILKFHNNDKRKEIQKDLLD